MKPRKSQQQARSIPATRSMHFHLSSAAPGTVIRDDKALFLLAVTPVRKLAFIAVNQQLRQGCLSAAVVSSHHRTPWIKNKLLSLQSLFQHFFSPQQVQNQLHD
jgi:hypothetical protein